MTLEELTAQREALLAARYRGVRTVGVEGRRVTYATDAEMAAATQLPTSRPTQLPTYGDAPTNLWGCSRNRVVRPAIGVKMGRTGYRERKGRGGELRI